jgi:opacity protein-like surface antigen
MFGLVCLSASAVLFCALNVSVMAAQPAGDDFYSTYIVNRLEIGTRIIHFSLLDDKKGQPFQDSFFGSVTQLKEDQDYLPLKLFVQYKIIPQFGVGLAYDRFSFAAGDWGIEGAGSGGADGKATLSGPLVYLLGRYPNATKFTPFCELGFALYSASFDGDASWASSNNKSVELDSTTGFYLGVGCDMQITEQFLIDLYGRYMNVSDVNGAWFLLGNQNGDVVLTPSYIAMGLGAKFLF